MQLQATPGKRIQSPSGTATRSWIVPEAEHLLPRTQGNIWVVKAPRAQSCHLTQKTNLALQITYVFWLRYILCACAGYCLVLVSLAFFLASSNINSLNNFSQGIHSAKRRTNTSLWSRNSLQSGLLLMKGLLCFHFTDSTTTLECDTLLDSFLFLQFPVESIWVLNIFFKTFEGFATNFKQFGPFMLDLLYSRTNIWDWMLAGKTVRLFLLFPLPPPLNEQTHGQATSSQDDLALLLEKREIMNKVAYWLKKVKQIMTCAFKQESKNQHWFKKTC